MIYYYNNEPLQLSYKNDYSLADKIEIVLQIQNDLKVGMLSAEQMRWIVENKRFGAWTLQREIDKLMFSYKIKINPITLDDLTNFPKKKPFDL
tara:strand:- start:180 stop:458 length:279 start_codon:yes stop_codon:yes gene_type:complete